MEGTNNNNNNNGVGTEDKNKTGENTNNNNNNNNNSNENNNNSNNNSNNVDEKQIGKNAISDLLKTLGVDDEDGLKDIVAKHNEQEEANKTDLQKEQGKVVKLEKKLLEEQEKRVDAELKLSALTMGANKEMVDDLVVVAKSRVTKDKDVNAVMAEIKEGATGKIYFALEDDDNEGNKNKKKKGKVVTRVESNNNNKNGDTDNNNGDNDNGEKYQGSIAARIFAKKQKTGKSNYFN